MRTWSLIQGERTNVPIRHSNSGISCCELTATAVPKIKHAKQTSPHVGYMYSHGECLKENDLITESGLRAIYPGCVFCFIYVVLNSTEAERAN